MLETLAIELASHTSVVDLRVGMRSDGYSLLFCWKSKIRLLVVVVVNFENRVDVGKTSAN